MAHTDKQFAIFNIPTSHNATVAPVDKWLFEFPIHTFDIGTPEETVFRTYETARQRGNGTRIIGEGRIESRIILKVRHVHYTDFVKVLGADRMPDLEKENA